MALAIALVITLAIGELATRVVAHFTLIYNLEMVKYARELKVSGAHLGVNRIHRANAKANLMGVEISLNSMGFRGPEIAAVKATGTKRVLVMGNSTTLGWGVPEDRVFTAVAAKRLLEGNSQKYEFVNAGIANFSTEFEHALLDLRLKAVHPDIVLLQYSLGDIEAKPIEKSNLLFKYSSLAAILYDRFSAVKFSFGPKKSSLADYYENLYFGEDSKWKTNRELLADMHAQAARNGVLFIVMIIPSSLDLRADSPFKKIYDEIEQAMRKEKIPVLNTFASFQKRFEGRERELWVQADDPHLNAAGHELMGELLAGYLGARTGNK